MTLTFIDLGLPSGTLWATENEPGYKLFGKELVKAYGDQLPPIKAWEELFKNCDRTRDNDRKGYLLTGPNGNTLFVPDAGYKNIPGHGFYWSSSPYGYGVDTARLAYYSSGLIDPQDYEDSPLLGFSVRLCKPAGAQ
jgi:hypothetical protein